MQKALQEYFYTINLNKSLEMIGAACGIAGALTMSFMIEQALFAWSVWLISSLSLAWFAFRVILIPLFVLQLVFVTINLSGIYNSIN